MVTRIIVGCMLSIALGVCLVTAAEPTVGQPAPDFTATVIDGKPVKLSSFRGGNVVLVFTRAYW
jgi:hypothetical protein